MILILVKTQTKIWAKVKNFNIEDYVSAKDARKMDEFTQYGIAAADEAMMDSGLVRTKPCRAVLELLWVPVLVAFKL